LALCSLLLWFLFVQSTSNIEVHFKTNAIKKSLKFSKKLYFQAAMLVLRRRLATATQLPLAGELKVKISIIDLFTKNNAILNFAMHYG
jgi:hypothetical protein